MPKKSFTVRMEAEQLERLDRARGLIPREAFVRQAIETAIERARATGDQAGEAREGEAMRSDKQHRVTGSLIVVKRQSGPVYFLKARDRDGRQIKRRLGPVADWPHKQAQDALRDFLTDLGRVPDRGDDSVTFTYAAAAYLRYVEHDRGRAPSTVRDYKSTIDVHLEPRFGEQALSAITVDDVEQLRSDLLDTLSPRTTQKTLILLHGIFRFAGPPRLGERPTPSPTPSG